jgi:hypothetical protein
MQGSARCGPDRVESFNEDVPESRDGDVTNRAVGLALRMKEIYVWAMKWRAQITSKALEIHR